MKSFLGKAILSFCFLTFLLSESKAMGNGSAYIPDVLPLKPKSTHLLSKKRARTSYTIVYMKDHYGIQDKKDLGIFKNIYDKRHGTLLASYERYFSKKRWVGATWGLGLGLGYNEGNPRFVSDTKSDVTFRLYTILLDASLGGELHPLNFLKLKFKGGPSLMGLYRSRDDLEHGEDGKNIRQVGAGGFAHIAAQIGMGRLFSSWGEYLYNEYQILELLLNFGVRYQYYSGFQKSQIQRVDGLSYMVGVSFELP